RVDRVVRLVPALRARLLEPALCLAELLARSRELLVQHQRDPAGRSVEAPPAAAAGEAVPLLAQGAAAERATQDLEQRHGHGILGGCVILYLAGLWDDVARLPPLAKIAAQLGASALVLTAGVRVEIVGNDVAATVLGVLWLVGMTNAFNLLDNMDGLAATLAA